MVYRTCMLSGLATSAFNKASGACSAWSVARKLTHARILLLADEHSADGGQTDESIAKVLHVGHVTVARVRCRFVEEGFEAALQRRVQRNRRARKLDGDGEAFLVATACSEAPEGRTAWTLKLLADRLVACEIVESISTETVRKTLKKTNSSLG